MGGGRRGVRRSPALPSFPHRSYCLLLLSHVDVDEDDLREQAVKYGLEDEIDALLQYLETHGEVDVDRLPEWSEFQELAVDYEVPLPQ